MIALASLVTGGSREQSPSPIMTQSDLYPITARLQRAILDAGPISQVPRVRLDAWASLQLWHTSGELMWRITPEQADRMMDEPLTSDLPLQTAPTRGPAVCYILPDGEWIVLARHSAGEEIKVRGAIAWSYNQPLLTYCTATDEGLSSGYVNLIDQPTPRSVVLLPGTGSISGPLTAAQITSEDYRLSLAIAQHYRP